VAKRIIFTLLAKASDAELEQVLKHVAYHMPELLGEIKEKFDVEG